MRITTPFSIAEGSWAQDIRVVVHGAVPAEAVEAAMERVAASVREIDVPIWSVRVRLTRHWDASVSRPVVAQATMNVNGWSARVQVEGSTAMQAVDALDARLRHQLARVAGHLHAQWDRAATISPQQWWAGCDLAHRPTYLPVPPGQRRVVRHKSCTLAACSVDDAAFDMNLLDHDFYFFIEIGSTQDSVLYRSGDAGFRLAQVAPRGPRSLRSHRIPVTLSAAPAVLTTVELAAERIDRTSWRFVFFVDLDHGRAKVLYRRFDGHLGLLAAA